jgi:hypothetical protein
MGPITLFDKSFIQSLSLDESVWFDHFFLTNVCPIFFIETLADLGKQESENKSPERIVEIIADKFPEFNSAPSAHHQDLCINDLLGHITPMTGQVVLDKARLVSHEGNLNVVAGTSPTVEAFQRWQQSEFEYLEREIAQFWRAQLAQADLTQTPDLFSYWPPFGSKCGSIEKARDIAIDFVNSTEKPYLRLELCFSLLEVPQTHRKKIRERWADNGFQSISEFAPYASFVVSVVVFFLLAIKNKQISPDRVSNLTDIAYLFYLPFCMVFISSDRLHRRIAPLFLRENQEFIWGIDLKESLAELNLFYSQFSDEQKNQGIHSLAPRPPQHIRTLISDLWDRHLLPWRGKEQKEINLDQFEVTKKKVEQMENLPAHIFDPKVNGEKEIGGVSMKRQIRKKKGSWYQIPKDIE